MVLFPSAQARLPFARSFSRLLELQPKTDSRSKIIELLFEYKQRIEAQVMSDLGRQRFKMEAELPHTDREVDGLFVCDPLPEL
jgi:hypothetical protein